jgi:hypothetical protein
MALNMIQRRCSIKVCRRLKPTRLLFHLFPALTRWLPYGAAARLFVNPRYCQKRARTWDTMPARELPQENDDCVVNHMHGNGWEQATGFLKQHCRGNAE